MMDVLPRASLCLGACLKIRNGAAARDFGCGQGGEVRASPQRAVRTEPTRATDKRPAARRVFAPEAGWLRCSSVEDPRGIFSFVTPRHPACGPKTAPFRIFRQALPLGYHIAVPSGLVVGQAREIAKRSHFESVKWVIR
jgi:hypothetical protein